MKIWLTGVFVDDLGKALGFYTNVLGFVKKADFTNGPYRWLTVVSQDDQDGAQLHLETNGNPASKAFQTALRTQGTPAAMFQVKDIEAEVSRLKGRGVKFSQEITTTPGSKIAILDDTCGNLIQLAQLGY